MQVAIKRDHGILKVEINNQLYLPLSFKSFRPNPQNISEFYQAGVRLFSVLSSGIISALGVPYSLYGESWIGEQTYDFSKIDAQMDLFLENAPDAYFAPMFQVDTRPWYLESHPGVPNSFTHLSQIACDETWRNAAAAYLKAAIAHCEEKYGDHIYGYFMLGGTTTEWFSDRDYEAPHPIKEAGYRIWSKNANATLPAKERLDAKGDAFLSSEEADIFQARKFHAQEIADLILYFAKEAQSVLHHRKLLGVYYGYLLELGGERLYNAGSLGYEKVYLSQDLDMISSPSAYGYRALTDPSAFMVLSKTLDAHQKLYFLEFDHITHVAPTMVQDPVGADSPNGGLPFIPGAANKCKTETESLNLMYRDYVLCAANGCAMWWFDMFDGWFRSWGMMHAVSHMLAIAQQTASLEKHSVAKIAVFAEGEAMYHTRKTAGLATATLSQIRRTLAEVGAPYDLYTLADISLPQMEQYSLILFLNQYDLSEETRKWIQDHFEISGKTVVWLYAPDYAHNGGRDVGKISACTRMRVWESAKSHGDLCTAQGNLKNPMTVGPYFAVDDPAATPLAYYADGAVAMAEKVTDGVRHVYAATAYLPTDWLATVVDRAGIFRYSRSLHVYTYVNSAFVGVYNATETDAEIAVPNDGTYQDLIEGGRYIAESGKLKLPLKPIRAYLLTQES